MNKQTKQQWVLNKPNWLKLFFSCVCVFVQIENVNFVLIFTSLFSLIVKSQSVRVNTELVRRNFSPFYLFSPQLFIQATHNTKTRYDGNVYLLSIVENWTVLLTWSFGRLVVTFEMQKNKLKIYLIIIQHMRTSYADQNPVDLKNLKKKFIKRLEKEWTKYLDYQTIYGSISTMIYLQWTTSVDNSIVEHVEYGVLSTINTFNSLHTTCTVKY